LGGATLTALLATSVQVPATAAPAADPRSDQPGRAAKQDDRPDRLEEKRRELKQTAFEQVVNGDRNVQSRGGSKAVRVAPGQWAEYGLEKSDELFSILVEFGGTGAPGDTDADGLPTTGPLHNEIPEPDRGADNSTYWTPDFDKQHYLDMFFNGMPEQGGESFKGLYEEMSSGRYTVNGDVSDWVKVDKPEAAYGQSESQTDMTAFIDDAADAWYDDQVAAGKSDAEIVEYLSRFDQWDRYDYDNDGNFDEPDGYLDHFQAIHAGEGEEAGAPEWAIWSHRWAVNQSGRHPDGTGPDGFGQFGGIEVGDSGLFIRDYTTEPENGGLGVFAHEYAHDLGLPDLYDTAGGENSTAFWTLMSSGSWLSHGDQSGSDAIGTTPNHMGPWEKLVLGWLDYEVVAPGERRSVKLGPSFHATKNPQAVVSVLPTGEKVTEVGTAPEGQNFLYSGRGDNRTATATSPTFTVPEGGELTAQTEYQIETDWDYAYAEISDGTGWTPLETNLSTDTDPEGQNDGNGITGSSDGWVPLSADLSPWAGQDVQLRFRMFNDAAYNELGFLVDDIAVGSALTEGAEDGAPEWTMDGFSVVEDGSTTEEFNHYYIAENRAYGGYDQVLKQGPYNFGWARTRPDWVEHFPYQDGMLVWYWNTSQPDNNVSQHPGAGEVLPVDARGKALRWSDGTVARNRIQAYDSTFGVQATDRLSLHRETADLMTTLTVGRQNPVQVFDDSKGERYYDTANPGGSVQVPDTGTTIRVVSENRNGMMQVRIN
jgi:immune inhibitor A